MSGDPFDCLETMLSTWLKGISPPPTGERLVAVLRSKVVDEEKKAAEIEEKFCTVVTPTAVPDSESDDNLISVSTPISDTDSVSSGPLSPGAESLMDVPVVSARSPVLFDNDDSFIGSITTSRARPSLISALEKIADPSVQERSKQKDSHFRTLVRKTQQYLSRVITTTEEFDDFKVAISYLPASLNGHHIVISPGDQLVIASATKIIQIIIVLNQYWTFVHYELLEYVVLEFVKGNVTLMNEMKAYIADMNEFEKEIGIDHFTALQLCSPRPDSVAMDVHLSGSQHKLYDSRLVQRSLAEQCGLHPHTVRTHKSNPGSTIFTLLIPYSVAGHVLATLRGMPLASEILSRPPEERTVYTMDEAETEMFLPMKEKRVFDATGQLQRRLRKSRSDDSLSTLSTGYATMSIRGDEEAADKKENQSIASGGTRAVMILGSLTSHSNKSVVPQLPADLSGDDRKVLAELGLPPEKWSNLNALLALYNKTEYYDVFSVQVSRPGMELSRSYILEQIEFTLKNSKTKTSGVVLHYYGNGRRNTGDWSFRDGFITFRDIADLYMKHSRGRGLTIVSDCHSSGRWVSECAMFLDGQGVKPCGHSAREKRYFLRVYASCEAGQDSAELAYTTRAISVKDGKMYLYTSKELGAKQRTFGVDFTKVKCGKGEKEKCSIAPDSTWFKAIQ